MVKVWDMTTHRAKEMHCVQTIASVARVKWRPECRHHLATCSMMVDHNIYVWDVRRPFVPAAMFEEHRDVTTGIAWRHPHDPSFLLSGSKDSTLCQHLFRDASQPVERANPEGLCYGLFGDLAFAAKESLVAAESGRKPYAGDRRHPIFFKRKLDPAEPFSGLASSALSVFETESGGGSMSWFVDTAERYALAGRPLAELCDHNAKVARELGRNQVCGLGAQGPRFGPETAAGVGHHTHNHLELCTLLWSVTMPAFAKVFDSVKDHVSQSSPDPGVSLRAGGLGSQVSTAPSSASLLVLELPLVTVLSP